MKNNRQRISKLVIAALVTTAVLPVHVRAEDVSTSALATAKEQVSIAQAEWESVSVEYDVIVAQAVQPKAEMESALEEYESVSRAYIDTQDEISKNHAELEQASIEAESVSRGIVEGEQQIEIVSENLQNNQRNKSDGEREYESLQAQHQISSKELARYKQKVEEESSEMESVSAHYEGILEEKESRVMEKESLHQFAKDTYERESETLGELESKLKLAVNEKESALLQYNEAVQNHEEAEQKAQDAKSARDEAVELESQGSLGFFENQNAAQALYDIRNCQYKDYIKTLENGATAEEAKKSATSLDNMKQSLVSLHWHQDLIRSLGMKDFEITHTLMAHAQANADYSANIIAHAQQFSGDAENLSWGYQNPFDGWYTKEKTELEEAMEDRVNYPTLKEEYPTLSAYGFFVKYPDLYQKVGHYLNIVDTSNHYTGMAYGTLSQMYANTYSQEFRNSTSEISYTLEEYETIFNQYYDKIYADIEGYELAVQEVEEAQQQEETAEQEFIQTEELVTFLENEVEKSRGRLDRYGEDEENASADYSIALKSRDEFLDDYYENQNVYNTYIHDIWPVSKGKVESGEQEIAELLEQIQEYENHILPRLKAEYEEVKAIYETAVFEVNELYVRFGNLQAEMQNTEVVLVTKESLLENLEEKLENAKNSWEEKKNAFDVIESLMTEQKEIFDKSQKTLESAKSNLEALEKATAQENVGKTTEETTTKTIQVTSEKTTQQTTSNTKVKNNKTAKIQKLKAGKKSVTIIWKKVAGIKGYQIQYSTSKQLKKATTKNVKKAVTTKKTIKKLKSKKKYYFRIRTYVKSGTKNVYSKWSKVKSTKVK